MKAPIEAGLDQSAAATVTAPVVTARWLVRFRLAVTVAAAALLALSSGLLGVSIPRGTAAVVLAVHAASNLWLWARVGGGRPSDTSLLGGFFALDIVLLTALLIVTGGPSNPFTVAYLVYITLAAVTLSPRWIWVVTALAVAGYGVLFVAPARLAGNEPAAHVPGQDAMPHLAGMWVAFLLAALLTASFVWRVRAALEHRERALAEARRIALERERLASLTTLAAGAAHELSTPLATIAVAACELERAARAHGPETDLVEDARLIRSQVDRCRLILDQMSGRADESAAEQGATVDPAQVVRAAVDTLAASSRRRVVVDVDEHMPAVRAPRTGFERVVGTLIKNGLDASSDAGIVEVRVRAGRDSVYVAVEDRGIGMSQEILARAGEPFFTTKPPGSGFGLGLFLARAFAEQWGGRLELRSREGEGTTATLELPPARDAASNVEGPRAASTA
jgi:two-component system sensor histidine kinase RegB